MNMKAGKLFVISAPSGTGKSTVVRYLLEKLPLEMSVSCTTRNARPGEEDGKHYYFISTNEFKSRIEKGEFIEWVQVYENYYGTLKSSIDSAICDNKNVLLDIEVQGGSAIKELFPEAITIFLMPPNLNVLRQRLMDRKSENEQQIQIRMDNAQAEMKFKDRYDYSIMNDNLEETVEKVSELISKELNN